VAQRDTRLQVPIDKAVLDKLQIRADELGFDSVPAMVRFWAKGETSEQRQAMRQKGLNNANVQVLRYVELVLALNPQTPKTSEQALKYLIVHLGKANFRKYFRDLVGVKSSDKIFGT